MEFTEIQGTTGTSTGGSDGEPSGPIGKFSPTISSTLDFGDPNESYDDEYPSSKNKMLLESTDVRLSKINYKTFEYTSRDTISYISAIQLEYTNGVVGPWFQHKEVGRNDKTETIRVPNAAINKVSMAVDRNIGIAGLKLSGPSGTVVDVDFGERSKLSSMWEHEPIPDG